MVRNTSDKSITVYVSNQRLNGLKSGEHKIPITQVTANLRVGCNMKFPWMIGQNQPIFCVTRVHQLNVEEKSLTSPKDTAVVFLYARPKLNFNDYYSWLRDGSFCEPKIANQSGSYVSPSTAPSLTQGASAPEDYFEGELVRCFVTYRLGVEIISDEALPKALLTALGAPRMLKMNSYCIT